MEKDLKQITVVGLGLLGGSITLTVLRSFPGVKAVGYSHRQSTREKARQLAIASEIADDLCQSVSQADMVILATPICTFEEILREIADALPAGCIVTDVGSTKVLPHRWAEKLLPKNVFYVGSHPIAGSEQRGIEFSRDDLFDKSLCILTATKKTNNAALETVREFWSALGCTIKVMPPAEHDKILASISHLPHITAASLVNAAKDDFLEFAGKGFIDTTRIASGPANIWADILFTNADNITKNIDMLTAELAKVKKAIQSGDKNEIEQLLEKARSKRNAMIEQKMKKKEIAS